VVAWVPRIDTWGSTEAERAASYPVDELLEPTDHVMFRALDVDAPAELAFRWLCQIRVAPYSYDVLDHRGKQSPRELTPGLDALEAGQTFMIFRLLSWQPGRSVTLRSQTWMFGRVLATYAAVPVDERRCRFVVKIAVGRRGGPIGVVAQRALAVGDLVMMRKQLRTLGDLAERDARRAEA
jgi:hypothetical protein